MDALDDPRRIKQIVERRFNVRLTDRWIAECLGYLKTILRVGAEVVRDDHVVEIVSYELLLNDLKLICTREGRLPAELCKKHAVVLSGEYLLQMEVISNIGASLSRYSDDNNEDDFVEEQDVVAPPGPTRMFKMLLTDGVQFVPAIEFRPIPALHASLPIHTTKLLVKDVRIRRGILQLVPSSVTVLEIENDESHSAHHFVPVDVETVHVLHGGGVARVANNESMSEDVDFGEDDFALDDSCLLHGSGNETVDVTDSPSKKAKTSPSQRVRVGEATRETSASSSSTCDERTPNTHKGRHDDTVSASTSVVEIEEDEFDHCSLDDLDDEELSQTTTNNNDTSTTNPPLKKNKSKSTTSNKKENDGFIDPADYVEKETKTVDIDDDANNSDEWAAFDEALEAERPAAPAPAPAPVPVPVPVLVPAPAAVTSGPQRPSTPSVLPYSLMQSVAATPGTTVTANVVVTKVVKFEPADCGWTIFLKIRSADSREQSGSEAVMVDVDYADNLLGVNALQYLQSRKVVKAKGYKHATTPEEKKEAQAVFKKTKENLRQWKERQKVVVTGLKGLKKSKTTVAMKIQFLPASQSPASYDDESGSTHTILHIAYKFSGASD